MLAVLSAFIRAIAASDCEVGGPSLCRDAQGSIASPGECPSSPENVSADGVLHGDKRLSQKLEPAMFIRLDVVANRSSKASITHYPSIQFWA
jgi:hypothetical protein